jgi:hypothetical protein
MSLVNRRGWLMLVLSMTVAVVAAGCTADTKGSQKQAKAKTDPTNGHGWWCAEHGIPEDICGLCNQTYRDQKKAEGDWCEEHNRLKSQCFKCDPSLYEKVFEPMYVAHYGKKPERPPEKEFTK